ncbi:MAG: hypothetical protein A2W90_04800 [Bacteroidetes bacterium GWF2_42_66]|nr:MAG: hypothetical protein A2W89_21020 [Bacteroidetes bacterium GWE2_42_39]OFY40808.1 MAG: hypothetical protein A2W90_04800 [Bacteroidetes bacterium GWF2_42_66]HBL75824.1 hypothetical protein [Prolixibacteraceae bacterium]HCU63073.1 hypothetical protein [Prolixibacteraceae bacterium]
MLVYNSFIHLPHFLFRFIKSAGFGVLYKPLVALGLHYLFKRKEYLYMFKKIRGIFVNHRGGNCMFFNLLYERLNVSDQFIFCRESKLVHIWHHFSCPQAGRALPFSIDKKEAKILSQRTLRRALGRPAHLSDVALSVICSFVFQSIFIPEKKQ